MVGFSVLIGILLVALAWGAWVYNRLIGLRNMRQEAWSGIDVQLKRRHDLIPNLVAAVKGYASHERSLFEDVARLRSQSQAAGSVRDKGNAEAALTASIQSLMAVAEAYPELKANDNFLGLQKDLSAIEDEIQLARRYYNGTVRNYNILIESFPSLLIARLIGAQKSDYFSLDGGERATPSVVF
jgi:LemA protein